MFGGPYDALAAFFPTFSETAPGEFTWNQFVQTEGDLSVQINSGDSGHGFVRVETIGTVGLATGSQANRDGVGAVVTFTPNKSPTAMKPILAGSNYSSQDTTDAIFGLGTKRKGTIEVLWPGGTRNQFFDAKDGETILMPEIPCDYEPAQWSSFQEYKGCVNSSLHELKDAGVITFSELKRLRRSAVIAYNRAD